jgi:hypothetical protein
MTSAAAAGWGLTHDLPLDVLIAARSWERQIIRLGSLHVLPVSRGAAWAGGFQPGTCLQIIDGCLHYRGRSEVGHRWRRRIGFALYEPHGAAAKGYCCCSKGPSHIRMKRCGPSAAAHTYRSNRTDAASRSGYALVQEQLNHQFLHSRRRRPLPIGDFSCFCNILC